MTVNRSDQIFSAAVILDRVAKSLDLQIAICPNIASNRILTDHNGTNINRDIFGWASENERWWDHSGLALTSSIALACRVESQPMWFESNAFHTRSENKYLADIDMSGVTSPSDLMLPESGILVPIHLPFGQIGLACYTPKNQSEIDLEYLFTAHSDQLEALSRRFLSGYAMVIQQKHRMPINLGLNSRVTTCLKWAARGKTDREIAMIMGVSHASIRHYLTKAGTILDSVNRGQSLYKAGQLGYIDFVG